MITFRCVLQEGCIPSDLRSRLVSGLTSITAEVLGVAPDDVQVEFEEIPRGAGYRGGELSTTSLVRGTIPPGCEQPVREQLLMKLGDMWCETVGCGTDEVVVNAADEDHVPNIY
ncbi:MAG: tautomerase family protein [Candidatus Tectomicrobia bacterium]|nr:tautomerase family protein [Candidatus Tectomicrobia bacterium]